MGKRRDMCIISRYKTKISVVRYNHRKVTYYNKNTKARGYTIDDKCVIISNSTGQGVVLAKKHYRQLSRLTRALVNFRSIFSPSLKSAVSRLHTHFY